LEEAIEWLQSEELAETRPESPEEAGSTLILNNPYLQERLYLMSTWHSPKKVRTLGRSGRESAA
jgi:hypothetical protein